MGDATWEFLINFNLKIRFSQKFCIFSSSPSKFYASHKLNPPPTLISHLHVSLSPCFTQFSIIFCSFSEEGKKNLCVVADKKEKIDFIVIVTVKISQQWHRNDHHLVFLLCLSAESNRQKKVEKNVDFYRLREFRFSLIAFE